MRRAGDPPWRLLEERRLDPHRPAVGSYRRTTDFRVSPTDPDATPMRTGTGTALGYHDHYVVDGGKARIILAALVTPADVMENVPLRDLLWRVCFRRKLRPQQVTGDTTYGTVENIVAVEDAGIRAYFPLPDFDRPHAVLRQGRVHLRRRARTRTAARRGSCCASARPSTPSRSVVYRADAATCNACPLKAAVHRQRPRAGMVHRSFYEDYLDRVRGYHATEAYQKAMRKRQVWVEPLFAEAKDWHGLRRLRLAGLDERQHPGAADRGRAEPEALPGRDRLGPAPCPVREPRGPPEGAMDGSRPSPGDDLLRPRRELIRPVELRTTRTSSLAGGFFQHPGALSEPSVGPGGHCPMQPRDTSALTSVHRVGATP